MNKGTTARVFVFCGVAALFGGCTSINGGGGAYVSVVPDKLMTPSGNDSLSYIAASGVVPVGEYVFAPTSGDESFVNVVNCTTKKIALLLREIEPDKAKRSDISDFQSIAKGSNGEEIVKYACAVVADNKARLEHNVKVASGGGSSWHDIGDSMAIVGQNYQSTQLEFHPMQRGDSGYNQRQMLFEAQESNRLYRQQINDQNTRYFMGRIGR